MDASKKDFCVFLLDDEPIICEILSREIRKRENLNVRIVDVPEGTGSAAIKALEAMKQSGHTPNLLIIDLRLNNGLTGFDVIDRSLQIFPRDKMTIAILTGCWEGSEDWTNSVKYLDDGKIDCLLGKWGLGQVLLELDKILDKTTGGSKTNEKNSEVA